MEPYSWRQAGFALYIHWPFCQAKCPYCDFNSYVSRSVDQAAWRSALLHSMANMAEITPERTLTSIFFGGGTPSLMPVETVAALIDQAQQHWHFTNDIEITLEANPTSVEAERFRGYMHAGVNRVSLGVQALNDADLYALGRQHTVREALDAYDLARQTFQRVSFDLIYARMHQTPQAWEAELHTALSHAADHMSLYQLTIEPGTRFNELYKRGKLSVPLDADGAKMYEITQDMCTSAGLPAYEISNHARDICNQSVHNLVYWRYGEYAGIGPGAHSRLLVDGVRCGIEAERNPEIWLQRAAKPASLTDVITPRDQAAEYLMMSLRLMEGSSLETFAQLRGEINAKNLDYLIDEGFLTRTEHTICATLKGQMVLNSVLVQLLG